jgi:hypothetical protein
MACLLAVAFLAVGCGGGDDQTEETRDTGAGGTAAGTGGTAAGTGGTASGGGETRASEVVGRWDIDRGGYADCGAEPTEWDTTIPGDPASNFG